MPTSGAPRMPAPPCNAIMKTVSPTKNGKAYTASVKISQQNKPIPAKFSRSPRASMVVAPYPKVWLRLPPPPRRSFGYAVETRRSCGDATPPRWWGRHQNEAHAPPNFQTEMPRRFALSARLSWIPVPGKCMTPIGSSSSMASLRLNGAALACFVQSGLKAICGTLRVVALVEAIPDQVVVIEVETARKCDLWASRQNDLGLGAALGCDELPRVDHGRSERAMVDKRSRPGAPGRTSVDLKAFDGLIAEEFETVTTFDQSDAFGRQALKFDRLHLRPVLLALAFALRLFVVVELACDAVGGTMEEVDR